MRILESLDDWGDDIAVIEEVEGEHYGITQKPGRGRKGSSAIPDADMDAQWDAALYGEEGPAARRERNLLDEIGEAMGVLYDDDEELWLGDRESARDAHRWELDPASADDWDERRRK